MRRFAVLLAVAWFTACWHVPVAGAAEKPISYRRVLERTAAMVENERAWGLVNRHGLDLVNVMWEDTGRYYGWTQGYTGRPTEWEGDHREPVEFWPSFWAHFEADTGLTPEETMRLLEQRLQHGWHTGVAPDRRASSPLACLPEPLLSL